MDCGKNLKKARENANITQEELAMRLGLSQSAIARYESGSLIINLPTAAAMAGVLGIKVDDLVQEG